MVHPATIFVCINKRGGKGCIGEESRAVFRALHARARERGGQVRIQRMTCLGECSHGPNAKIKGGQVFNRVTLDDVERILDAAET